MLAKMFTKRLRGYRALGFERAADEGHPFPLREYEIDYFA